MFVPFHDQNPLRYIRFPWVTRGLVVLNCLIFLIYQRAGNADAEAASVMAFGLIPSTLAGIHIRTPGLYHAPEYLTFITSSFLHGDIWHLAGNMLFLWVFGDNVEDAMGHIRFILFYFLCAIGGGLAHVMVEPGSDIALIGASGSVAGVIAAYLVLHPRVKIWILLLFRVPIRLRTVWVLGFWILLQVYNFAFGAPGEISWAAHLGGLLMGTVLVLFFRRPGVPLLARQVDEEMPVDPVI
ncbi:MULTISPECIES: rhomboid family intramembrane serine protease [Kaistia]|jgi:membrane associated rhomboid family serine protease|uniref:rhomboid family intramembrane serine protease n=1 Tax=Kaistia TaxID=166953 RepID=UPI002253DF7A|nr:rhomboid family intramembrane serine protease [Kaistia defluvii]MCX5518625.1 rhomboid family intramembrane serine protease [Kaistia defluvii]